MMIFRYYKIYSDGDSACKGCFSLSGGFDHLMEAKFFLEGVGFNFFPTVEIKPDDKISKECASYVLQMFFMQQLMFFLCLGREIKVFDLDIKKSEVFGRSVVYDQNHADRLGLSWSDLDDFLLPETTYQLVVNYLYKELQKTFWVEGFTQDSLIIHVTRKRENKLGVIHVS